MELKSVILSLLGDTETYLRQITPSHYAKPIPLLSNATIGQHTRHFIEFFQCLLQQSPHQVINYDRRERNKQIEEDPAFALQITREIAELLPAAPSRNPLTLEADYYISTQRTVAVETNFERELLYNIEHTIHHLAIIKIGLKQVAPHINLPGHFGIAPSTIRHRASQQASD